MATSPAENATLGRQSLTTVVTARDTDIDPGIADMSTVEDGVAMLHGRQNSLRVADRSRADRPAVREFVRVVLPDRPGADRGDSVAAGRPRAHAATRCDLRTILESITVHPDRTSITMTYNTATTRHALFNKISVMTDGGVPEVSHDGNQ